MVLLNLDIAKLQKYRNSDLEILVKENFVLSMHIEIAMGKMYN